MWTVLKIVSKSQKLKVPLQEDFNKKKTVKRVTLSLLGLEPTYPTKIITWKLVTFDQKLYTYLPQENSDTIFPKLTHWKPYSIQNQVEICND